MNGHPYKHLERLPEWKALNRALSALTENGDLKELTPRRYIVGYLMKLLLEAKGLETKAPKGVAGRHESNGHRFRASDLRTHRTELGLSAKDYGKLIGVSGLTVYHWEAGKAKPRDQYLSAITAVRGLRKDEALSRLSVDG